MDVKHDVAANSSDLSTAYTVTSYTDLQDYLGVTYACSVPSNSTLNAAVQACAGLNSRTCCVEYGRLSLNMVKLGSLKQACASSCLVLRHNSLSMTMSKCDSVLNMQHHGLMCHTVLTAWNLLKALWV